MAAATAGQWYYIDEQQNYVGPVDANGLTQLRKHGYVNGNTYVWSESLSGWEKLDALPHVRYAKVLHF